VNVPVNSALSIAVFKTKSTYGAVRRSRRMLLVFVLGVVLLPLPGTFFAASYFYHLVSTEVIDPTSLTPYLSLTLDLLVVVAALVTALSPTSLFYTFADEYCIAASPCTFREFFLGACAATFLNVLVMMTPIFSGASLAVIIVGGKSIFDALAFLFSASSFAFLVSMFVSSMAVMYRMGMRKAWLATVLALLVFTVCPAVNGKEITLAWFPKTFLPGSLTARMLLVSGLPGLTTQATDVLGMISWSVACLLLAFTVSGRDAFQVMNPTPLIAFGQPKTPRLLPYRYIRAPRFKPFKHGVGGALVAAALTRIARGGQLMALTVFVLSIDLAPWFMNRLTNGAPLHPLTDLSLPVVTSLILAALLSTGWFVDIDEMLVVFSAPVKRSTYAKSMMISVLLSCLLVSTIPTALAVVLYGIDGWGALTVVVGTVSNLAVASGTSLLVAAFLKPRATEIVFSPSEITTVFASMTLTSLLVFPVIVSIALCSLVPRSLFALVSLVSVPFYAIVIFLGEYRLLSRRLDGLSL